MTFSEFNSLRNKLQKDIPNYEPEYAFLNNYHNVANMTTKEFTETIESSKNNMRKRKAMKPSMVFELTQMVLQENLPSNIKEDMIDQLHTYEDCKLSERPDIEINLTPYPSMTFVCRKTYLDAHNEFIIQFQKVKKENINVMKQYIKIARQNQENISTIKDICESINKDFPQLGNEFWELTMDFIGSLAFRTTDEAKIIIKKISLLLKKCKFTSDKDKKQFTQKTIEMIKKCYSKPKRPKLVLVINSLTKQSQIYPTKVVPKIQPKNATYLEQYLLSSIPNGTKKRAHIKSRDAIIEYIKIHPNISRSKIVQWVQDIKTGRFTIKELR